VGGSEGNSIIVGVSDGVFGGEGIGESGRRGVCKAGCPGAGALLARERSVGRVCSLCAVIDEEDGKETLGSSRAI
jgi:hypothetical protein